MKKISIGILGVGAVAVIVAGSLMFLNSDKASSPPQSDEGTKQDKPKPQPPPDPTKHSYSDTDFARKMIVYNQQAMELANLVQHGGSDSDVSALAKEITETHGRTADKYANWLKGWGETYQNLSDFPKTDGHDAYPTFTGLAAAYELQKMTEMSKDELEKEFVRLILQHHEGALEHIKNMGGDKLQYGEMKEFLKTDTEHYTKEVKSITNLKDTKGY